jgi:hypothetical protein
LSTIVLYFLYFCRLFVISWWLSSIFFTFVYYLLYLDDFDPIVLFLCV